MNKEDERIASVEALRTCFNVIPVARSSKIISAEMEIPLGTIKSWITRYKRANDISSHVLQHDSPFPESEIIKIERRFKTREKTPEQTDKTIILSFFSK